jgi:hypothetical protein
LSFQKVVVLLGAGDLKATREGLGLAGAVAAGAGTARAGIVADVLILRLAAARASSSRDSCVADGR